MKITEYIRDHWIAVWITLLTAFLTGLFLLLMGTEMPVIAAVEILFLVGNTVCGIWDCSRKKGITTRCSRRGTSWMRRII